MDGLLFDTEKFFQETWNEKAAEMGITLDPQFKYRIAGTGGEAAFRAIEEFYGVVDGESLAIEVYDRVAEKVIAAATVPEKPGMREILALFKENGVKMAVASTTEIRVVKKNIERTGIESYFDAVLSGRGLPHGKPAPDIFLLAAEKIGIAPEDCYVFEDSVSGILAAHAGGMTPVMIPDLLQPDEEIRKICAGVYPTLSAAADAIRRGEI